MVSEPTTAQCNEDPGSNDHESERHSITPPAYEQQPRWMAVTVALSGIFGLIVMILLVR
jgi:hypothetical protein